MENITVGLVGLDTSHCIAFTQLLNDPANPHHVPGARIVAAYPGGSEAMAVSRDRVANFTERMQKEHDVAIVPTIEALAETVDAIFLTSVDGRQHLGQFARIAPFGKPVFIDKPLATTVADARAIQALSTQHDAPFFSASSIRYMPSIVRAGADGDAKGCVAYGGAPLLPDFPSLFWYGVHAAEVLYAKLGPGCAAVTCTPTDDFDVITGRWHDGRVGVLYLNRVEGAGQFAATVITPKGVTHSEAKKDDAPPYASLLAHAVTFCQTRKSPVSPEEMLEVVAFLATAHEARQKSPGIEVPLSLD